MFMMTTWNHTWMSNIVHLLLITISGNRWKNNHIMIYKYMYFSPLFATS